MKITQRMSSFTQSWVFDLLTTELGSVYSWWESLEITDNFSVWRHQDSGFVIQICDTHSAVHWWWGYHVKHFEFSTFQIIKKSKYPKYLYLSNRGCLLTYKTTALLQARAAGDRLDPLPRATIPLGEAGNLMIGGAGALLRPDTT